MTLFANGVSAVRFRAPAPLLGHASMYFSVAPEGAADIWTVTANPGDETATTLPDQQMVRGEYGEPFLSSASGDHLLSLVSGAALRIDRADREVVVHGDTLSATFVEAYRAARQLLIRSLLVRGAIVLHSSAVLAADGVTIFLGRKGAGKTSSVWQSLLAGGGELQYVANERVLLLPTADGVHVYGWPSTAFVGLGTIASTVGLAALDRLHDRAGGTAWLMTDHRWVGRRLAAGLAHATLDPALAAHKVYLLPGEVAWATGSTLADGGPLRRIVFPEVVPGGRTEVRRTTLPAQKAVIAAEVLGPGDLRYPDVLSLGGQPPTEITQDLWHRLRDVELICLSGPDLAAWRK